MQKEAVIEQLFSTLSGLAQHDSQRAAILIMQLNNGRSEDFEEFRQVFYQAFLSQPSEADFERWENTFDEMQGYLQFLEPREVYQVLVDVLAAYPPYPTEKNANEPVSQ